MPQKSTVLNISVTSKHKTDADVKSYLKIWIMSEEEIGTKMESHKQLQHKYLSQVWIILLMQGLKNCYTNWMRWQRFWHNTFSNPTLQKSAKIQIL